MSRILRPGLALPLAALLAIAPLAAQAPAAPSADQLPAARTIINRHVRETRGREAILAQTSTYAAGTVPPAKVARARPIGHGASEASSCATLAKNSRCVFSENRRPRP